MVGSPATMSQKKKHLKNPVTQAAGAGAVGAGAQAGAQTLLLLQLLSMVQSAVMTAVSWLGGLVAAVQAVGTFVVAAIFSGALIITAVIAVAVSSLSGGAAGATVDFCVGRSGEKAVVESFQTDASMVGTAQKIWAVASGWGMSNENIAGILGNFQAESGMDPSVVQGHQPLEAAVNPDNGIGLGQWTFTRNIKLREHADSVGQPWTDLGTQLDYMINVDSGSWAARRLLTHDYGTAREAAIYWLHEWERPADQSASVEDYRGGLAEHWYALMGAWDASTIDTGISVSVSAQSGSDILAAAASGFFDAVLKVRGALSALRCPVPADDDEWAWPVPQGTPVTSPYGPREAPVPGASTFHEGVDLGAACGTPVNSVHAGRVTRVSGGTHDGSTTGWITVDVGDGALVSYLHSFSEDDLVSAGQEVSTGQQLTRVGTSGASSGCHLDFRVRIDGQAVNPSDYLAGKGIVYQ